MPDPKSPTVRQKLTLRRPSVLLRPASEPKQPAPALAPEVKPEASR